MEEGEPEHEGAANGVEPRVDRVQNLLEGRAAASHLVVGLFFSNSKSPETAQSALGRAVVGRVVGEEGQVVAVEIKLGGDHFGQFV